MQSARSSSANDDEKPTLKIDDDFDKGFAFSGLVAGSGGRAIQSKVDRITKIVDSGASDRLVNKQARSNNAGQHEGLQAAQGAEDHHHRR